MTARPDRVLFGTDGHGSPETHRFAASVLRSAWHAVRGRLRGQVRDGWLDNAETRLFRGNAVATYRLGLT